MPLDLAHMVELRRQLADVEQALDRNRAELDDARAAEARARRADRATAASAHREAIEQLIATRATLQQQHAALLAAVDAARAEAEAEHDDPADRFDVLAADVPVLLLPLRIETRYLPVDDEPTELVVRIYPDELHIDDHDPLLTAGEEGDGREYWRRTWRAGRGGDPLAWEWLGDVHGAPRAAWIVRATAPLNRDDRPDDVVPDGEELPVAPEFPDRDHRPAGASRPARAAWLPERFVALGYTGGRRAFAQWGSPVSEQLLAGVVEDPTADHAETIGTAGDTVAVDVPELAWLTDLDTAVAAGMAIRVPLPDGSPAFERLIVLGVRTDTAGTGADFERLLEHQAHSLGAEIAAVGRPTNQSAGPPAAGPPRTSPVELVAGTCGAALGSALGLDQATVGVLSGAERVDATRAMHALLWPSTLGYFLEQMVMPALRDETIDATRRWFLDEVRGRGPLPSLIIGAQPYGVLPVTLPARLAPEDPYRSALVALLARLRGWWVEAVSRAPRLGRTDDPEADLTEVLGQAPVMQRLRVRQAFGRHYLENLFGHPAQPSPIDERGFDVQRVLSQALFATLGNEIVDARMTDVGLLEQAARFRGVLVASELSAAPLEDDYLADTRKALVRNLATVLALPDGGPLLQRLARHGALLSLAEGAGRVLQDVHGWRSRVLVEAELVDIEHQRPTTTALRRLEEPVLVDGTARPAVGVALGGARASGLGSMDAIVDHDALVDIVTNDAHRGHAGLLELDWALARLSEESTASLDLLVRETLDVCSHRLDAWYTSLAWHRLRRLRETVPTGHHLGAYGLVERLEPSPPLDPVEGPAGGEPVFGDRGNGYVHTPSLDHAATAAVLRAGYLAHGPGDEFAVDLSAGRVRVAAATIDAIRAGHPMAAILGYRFERRLHELGLDRYVPVFRALAPLHAEHGSGEQQVVDGLQLRTLFEDRQNLADHHLPGSAADHAHFVPDPELSANELVEAVAGVIDELDVTVDAVADLLVADAVHASVRGNPARARAIADAARAGTMPPQPDVMRTPRTGVAYENRVVLATNAGDHSAPGWTGGDVAPRHTAEPRLDRWAGSVLGDPARLVQPVAVVSPDGNAREVAVTVAGLGVCALDVVYGLHTIGSGGRSELDLRVVRAVETTQTPALPAGARIEVVIDPSRVPWRVLADELYGILTAAPALGPSALVTGDDPPGVVDEQEWSTRASRVRDAVAAVLADLERASEPAAASAAAARLAAFGLADGLITAADDGGVLETPRRDDLIRQASARLARAATESTPTAQLHALLGDDFRSVPLVMAGQPDELAATLAHSTALQGGDRQAAHGWLVAAGRVRPEADRLARIVALGMASGHAASLLVGQLPHDPDPGRRWIGLPLGDLAPFVEAAFVVTSPDDLDVTGPVAGLLIDTWADVVPHAEETTGLAFHFDRPSAEAPNCLLLAVHPGDRPTWDLDTVADTVIEAAELARVRAVDLHTLQMVGRVLPAIYVPSNVAGDTVGLPIRNADFVPPDAGAVDQ